MEVHYMENERFAYLNDKLKLVKLKIEKINDLLVSVNNHASKSIEKMNSVSDDLLKSQRVDAFDMAETMNTVEKGIKGSLSEQLKKIEKILEKLINEEDALTDLKENNTAYSQAETYFYIKEVNMDLQNSKSWYKPENNFTKISFNNHGGLRGMIFKPIADFNKKSDKLAKAIYEVEVLINEIEQERLNIELDRLKAIRSPITLDTQPESISSTDLQLLDSLAEYQSSFESTSEGSFIKESSIGSEKMPSLICDCGGIGRTGFC
ncbi:hypothetical protein J1N41_11975 [Providencia rettgeri]|nr:hypothetical protein [Providencia rettgeri]